MHAPRSTGRESVKLAPPLTIEVAVVEEGLSGFREVVRDVENDTNSAANFLRHHGVIGPSSSNLVAFYVYFGFTDVVAEEIPSASNVHTLSGGAWNPRWL